MVLEQGRENGCKSKRSEEYKADERHCDCDDYSSKQGGR